MTRVITSNIFKSAVALLLPLFSVANASDNNCYINFSESEYSDARTQCQVLAELGDAKAAFLLANIYYQGLEIEQDEQRALFWDQIAADKGHPDAAYRLALAYQLGQGVTQSNSKARSWYMQAALAQHPKAQKQLGAMFENGSAGEVNKKNAFEWYLRAAKQGLADAQFRAGTMLLEGEGVAKDTAHAQHWIRKAAIAGYAPAQVALGVLLLEIDPQESIDWYAKAAEQENGLALENMAWVYYSGQGVEQNDEQAKRYAEHAVAVGNEGARALLNRLQIDQQQQRIEQLKTEKEQLQAQMIKALPKPAAGNEKSQGLSSQVARTPENKVVEEAQMTIVSSETQSLPSLHNDERLPDGWILSQPSDAYTIQLTYGMEERGIQKFIHKHKLQERVSYYRTRRNAGIYYIVVFGQFSSVAEARKGLAELPLAAQRDHWIRNVSQLQDRYRNP